MAHLLEHCNDCLTLLNDPCQDVNEWIDQAFQQFGPRHRFVKHHAEGVEKAFELFGERGRKAALIHILKDCGHIPTRAAYEQNEVDFLGRDPDSNFNGHWESSAFIKAARKLTSTL